MVKIEIAFLIVVKFKFMFKALFCCKSHKDINRTFR